MMLPDPPAPPFVKICGFTDPANLRAVCEADTRPDAVGLNTYKQSARYCGDFERHPALLEAAGDVPVWCVTVNEHPRWTMDSRLGLAADVLQLHGDENPGRAYQCRRPDWERPVVRAWRVGESLDPLVKHLAAADADAARIAGPHRDPGDLWRADYDAVLLDAAVPGTYGGTGTRLDWHAVRAELDRVGDRLPRVILAGGLTPESVAEAVRVVRPWGVDVAGGVESSPGVKDPAKVRAFIEAAKGAA